MLSGGCLCGGVRFEIEGRLSPMWMCHCSKCRRATGSAFHVGSAARKAAFRWIRGETDIAEYESTPAYRRRFCRVCGSPVPLHHSTLDFVLIPAGSLDQDPHARPAHHIFVGSKAAWYEIHDDLPQFDEHAPQSD